MYLGPSGSRSAGFDVGDAMRQSAVLVPGSYRKEDDPQGDWLGPPSAHSPISSSLLPCPISVWSSVVCL
jgi:hypothetical protein